MAGIPQDLRAPANGIFNLNLKLFTLPSYFDFLRVRQYCNIDLAMHSIVDLFIYKSGMK
jgi:hypothetical protein